MNVNTDLIPNESWVMPEWCRPCERDRFGWPVQTPCRCSCVHPMIYDGESGSGTCSNCGKPLA